MLDKVFRRTVSIDTSHLDPRLVLQQPRLALTRTTLDRPPISHANHSPPTKPPSHRTRFLLPFQAALVPGGLVRSITGQARQ